MNQYIFLSIVLVLVYLILGTGLHGDDFVVIDSMQGYSLKDFFTKPEGLSIFGLVGYYLYWWPYSAFGYEYQLAYDLIKIVAHMASIYLVYRFSKDYFSNDRALILAVVFVMYPLHDTTTYWYMTFSYILVPSVLLYAHYLIRKNNLKKGFLMVTLGAFSSYASPAYIFGLTTIFLFEKKFKKAVVFVAPGAMYVIFYFWVKFNYAGVERRIDADLSIVDFLKQMLIQPLSFLESAIGP